MMSQLKARLMDIPIHLMAIGAVVWALLPVYWIAVTSVQSYGTYVTTKARFIPTNLTFQAYPAVIFTTDFPLWMRNSLLVTVPTIALTIALAAPAAYAFSRGRFYGKHLLLGSILVFQFLPVLTTLLPLFLLLRDLHLLNLAGLILLYTTLSLPFSIWNLKLYFDAIPLDIEENAMIDGASPLVVLRHIVMPLAAPAVVATCAFVFVLCWNEYMIASVVLLKAEYYTLPVAFGSVSSQWLQLSIPWPQFAALSVLTCIPFVIVFMVAQRYIQAGLMRGALRG